jgi:hypothetical protein
MTAATQARVALVLSRMAAMSAADGDDAEMISEALEGALNELAGQEGFGTEQQSDPRGDFRNGRWSMSHVEGVDI